MDRNEIIESAIKFTHGSPKNYIDGDIAIDPDFIGMKLFEEPIFAFGPADDDLYTKYKSPDIIGDHFLTPYEWLPNARTVISFFLPYTDRIKHANARDCRWPADEWLHGRIEGQSFVMALCDHLKTLLSKAGYETIVPSIDKRFQGGTGINKFTSNWSERHIAFACGLGTFGLSKGLITKKGMSGRFGSVVTELKLSSDVRDYSDVYEYCTMCGSCIALCPANAISFSEGKKHPPCSDFLDTVLEKHKPRYGCGKCQVNVPCESKKPD